MTKVSNAILVVAVSAISSNLWAFERDLDAHEHGHAMLAIAVEKDEVMMELTSPAINIVGFEHHPSTDKDRNAVEHAEHELKHADELFVFNEKAGCELEHVSVQSSLLEHGEENHAKDDHHNEHDEHDEHDNHDGHGKEAHSEFVAEYHYECSHIDQLNSMDVGLFKVFSGMEEVEAQLLGPKGQSLHELNADSKVVKF